jgi:hypothetical protein
MKEPIKRKFLYPVIPPRIGSLTFGNQVRHAEIRKR